MNAITRAIGCSRGARRFLASCRTYLFLLETTRISPNSSPAINRQSWTIRWRIRPVAGSASVRRDRRSKHLVLGERATCFPATRKIAVKLPQKAIFYSFHWRPPLYTVRSPLGDVYGILWTRVIVSPLLYENVAGTWIREWTHLDGMIMILYSWSVR